MKKNKKGKTNKKNYILFFVIISIVFISIYILNHFSVFTSDDYSFLYDYNSTKFEEGITRVSSISQIIESMKNLYLYVNGRVFPHSILQFLLMFPKFVFNIFNSIIYLLFGILIYKIINRDKSFFADFKPVLLILIYILMFLLFPTFGLTILWCSGSLNYLWHTFFVLLYFWYLQKLVNSEKRSVTNYILIFVLSFISANGPENASLASLFFTIMVIILDIIKHKKFNYWLILPLVGNILGIYVLFSAASLGNRELREDAFTISRIIKTFVTIIKNHLFSVASLLISFGAFMLINYKKKSNANDMYLYSLTALFSFAPLLVSPYVEGRMFFLSASVVIILIVYLFNMINSSSAKYIVLFSFSVLWLYVYIFVCFKDVKKSYDVYIDIENIILENKENENKIVYIPYYYREYSDYTAFSNEFAFPAEFDEYWINEWIAFYYGVDYLIVDRDIKYDKLYD